MPRKDAEQKVEARFRALIEDRAEAIRVTDADRALARYTADVVVFDLPPPLRSTGAGALDKTVPEAWFATFRGPIGLQIRDLSITAGDDVAFCLSLHRIRRHRTARAAHGRPACPARVVQYG